MNCPSCHNRNPSTAKRCLHCGEEFKSSNEGSLLSLVADDENGINWNYVVFGGIALFFAVIMGVKGFSTHTVECTTDNAEAAKYEASPDWMRDTSAEQNRRDHQDTIDRDQKDLKRRLDNKEKLENLQCFKKKTGEVKGIAD